MAADTFLNIDGIKGESEDSKHTGEIEVIAWSWGESQTATASFGGGSGAGKVNMQDFHFSMHANKASTELMYHCASGKHIGKAVLTARKAGEEQQEYLTYTMTDCVVSSYQTGGSGEIPIDSVTLNFAKIEVSYKPQKKDGTLDSAVKFGWNVKENKKV